MKLVAKFLDKRTDEVKAQILFLEDKDIKGMAVAYHMPYRYLVIDFVLDAETIDDYKSYLSVSVIEKKLFKLCASIDEAKEYLAAAVSSTANLKARRILFELMNTWHTADDSAKDLQKVQEMIGNAFDELNFDCYFKEYQY